MGGVTPEQKEGHGGKLASDLPKISRDLQRHLSHMRRESEYSNTRPRLNVLWPPEKEAYRLMINV